ncbi:unnamed protein product [Clonostachys rosea f. rosea IK726]|uniref:Uncharacterized protein n=1 Tax=Clonostachys rosea f. rosea IK726 TaxID=1349383 RepID=A0ACA9TS06_BIOOC|nr:unnamed protein product [Clonostachys rosea f. rosea IK726]
MTTAMSMHTGRSRLHTTCSQSKKKAKWHMSSSSGGLESCSGRHLVRRT